MITIKLFTHIILFTGIIEFGFNLYVIMSVLHSNGFVLSKRITIYSFLISCLTGLLTIFQINSINQAVYRAGNILILYKVFYLVLVLLITILTMNLLDLFTLKRKNNYILRFFLFFILYLPLTLCLIYEDLFSVKGILKFYLLTNLMCICALIVIWFLIYIRNREAVVRYGLIADFKIIFSCAIFIAIFTFRFIANNNQTRKIIETALTIVVLFLPNLIVNGIILLLNSINKRYVSEEEPGGVSLIDSSKELLTTREAEILDYVLAGYTAKETANFLCLSARTVEKHIENIYSKYNVQSRIELMRVFRNTDNVEVTHVKKKN